MTSYKDLSSDEIVRTTLHWDVKTICEETCHNIGVSINSASVAIIAEMVYKKLLMYGLDLESFAKHAKRSVINTDDVKLLVRRNPSLVKVVTSKSNPAQIQKRRTTTPNLNYELQTKKPKVNQNQIELDLTNLPSTSRDIY